MKNENSKKKRKLLDRLGNVIRLIRAAKLPEALEENAAVYEEAKDDAEIRGKVHARWGEIHAILGDLERCRTHYENALELLAGTETLGTQARVLRGLASALFSLGRRDEALKTLRRAHSFLGSVTEPMVGLRAELEYHILAGLIQAELNHPARTARHYTEAQTLTAAAMTTSSRRAAQKTTQATNGSPLADPLILGQLDLLGGLAKVPYPKTRDEGVRLMEAAVSRFAGGPRAESLPYYEARANDYLGRAILDPKLVRRAARGYDRIGARHLLQKAERWISENPRAVRVPTLPAGETLFHGIISVDQSSRDVISAALRVARTETTVLILGERGTGKEGLARLIHEMSSRAKDPLVTVDCTNIQKDLEGSELFGYEKGAFTGASARKIGKVHAADKGTLFLDEIGQLPLNQQAKLLRTLQEKTVEPVGATRPVKVDFRLVTATNRDLEQMTKDGTFLADLFDRINVYPLQTTPLRDRRGEIPALAEHFTREIARRNGFEHAELLSDALAPLLNYSWPGNVRDLKNVLEAAIVDSGDGPVDAEILKKRLGPRADEQDRTALSFPRFLGRDYVAEIVEFIFSPDPDATIDAADLRDGLGLLLVSEAMKRTDNSQTSAAKLLEMPLATLQYYIKQIEKEAAEKGVTVKLRRKRGRS